VTFNSLQFAAFFVVVLVLYHRLDRRGQNALVFVAGSFFYATFDWRFLGLLYLSIAVDYLVGRGLAGTQLERRRKTLLATSLVVQLGILGVFKYFDFFTDSAASLLAKLGLHVDPPTLAVALPVGISFYTFQSLAYVFAVYRRELEAERDLVTFAAFVAWFPQLVAGPIERATSLMPQLRRHRPRPDAGQIESGLLLILRGLVKKVVIADGVAAFVTTVYAAPDVYGWQPLALATVGFAVQVYGDFSGYSDIARGTSRLLGVELRWNFEQPFLSRDMREFWQRWHTSLGWWFTEFVGRPLGAAKGGRVRAGVVVLVIFTLIGLWHGPSWTFVVWGTYNGVLVVIWRNLKVPARQHPMKIRAAEIPRIVRTFLLFCLGAVFFRATTFAQAGTVLRRMAGLDPSIVNPPPGGELVPIMLAAVVVLDLLERRRRIVAIETTRTRARLGATATPAEVPLESMIGGMSDRVAGLVVGAMVVALVIFSGGASPPFLYFQF
jgi:D-alanyl-lipoteichoic acid acyltransferase DltB (MBOAT superfamily)